VQYLSRHFNLEGGAKNPPKGISVKLLVLASDAQFGACAESRAFIRKDEAL
jgi:hypothetical protein